MIPFLAVAALKLSPVGRILKAIPRPVWIALAVIAILLLGTCAHKRSVKRFGDERYAAGVKAEGDRIAAKAEAIKRKADALTGKISTELRKQSDEKVRIIYRDAGTVLMRGPGKAACGSGSQLPGATGRSNPPAGQGSSAVAEMPSGERIDLIGLPFAGTVALAQTCDLNRAEAQSWRDWHAKQSEAWKKLSQ